MTRRSFALALLLLAPLLAPQQWATGQPLEFELHYRGLPSLEEYPFGCRMIDSFGTADHPGSSFTQSLVSPDRNLVFYTHWSWARDAGGPKQLAWIAAELDGAETQHLFLDIDGNGSLSKDEKISPAGRKDGKPWFLTPDFEVRTEDGQTWPLRLIFIARSPKDLEIRHASMWTGRCTSKGNRYRLSVCDLNTNGRPTDFGEDIFRLEKIEPMTFAMLQATAKRIRTDGLKEARRQLRYRRYRYLAEEKFSSHVPVYNPSGAKVFWKCEATAGTPPVIRFREDKRNLGTVSVTRYPAYLDYLYDAPVIVGEKDSPAPFFLSFNGNYRKGKLEAQVPEGRYRIRPPSALHFPEVDGKKWLVTFYTTPTAPFDAPSSTTTVVELARPDGLSVTTYRYRDGRPSGPEGGDYGVQGEDVHIVVAVKGKAGDQFLYRLEGSRCLRARVRITSSKGETVLEGENGAKWDTSKTPPGKYTIKATYPIPPLHTEMKDEISFEVKPAGPLAQGGDSR